MQRLGVERTLAYAPAALIVWVATFESGVHATIAGVALAALTPVRTAAGREVLEQLEGRFHLVTSYAVLPLFALANAGVELGGSALDQPSGRRIALAVLLGLVAGKVIGISAATLAALRLRLGSLPPGVDLRSVFGVAALGGIGFTVSLFITGLAYSDPGLTEAAKLGVLAGSVLSAAIGVAILAPGGRHPSRR
jgi:NhaA family Na+:H+ antiporter